MSVLPPRLDDADAAALLAQARAHLRATGARWQAVDASDPGLALLEAFSVVTAEELKRLNRVPEAMLGHFLHLLGVTLRPAQVAAAHVTFKVAEPRPTDTVLPAGLRVTADHPDADIFALVDDVSIMAGATQATGLVAAARAIALREVGVSTGLPVQEIALPHDTLPGAPAAVAGIDVLARWPVDPPTDADVVIVNGTTFVRYAERISQTARIDGYGFVADRVAGRLRLTGDAVCVPPAGAQIMARYFVPETRGATDSSRTPVGVGQLSVLLDPAPGVSVSNPAPVAPGHAAQRREDLMRHGALAGLLGGQAVRPRDYEELAMRAHPAMARAHAFTEAEIWGFADPGRVTIRIAPSIDLALIGESEGEVAGRSHWFEALEAATSHRLQGAECLSAVQTRMTAAQPLGASVDVAWLKAKPVGVSATVYVSAGVEHSGMAEAVRRRLDAYLAPVPGGVWPQGWPVGRTLRQSELIETILNVPGVRAADKVTMHPRFPMDGATTALGSDARQAGMWYAVVGGYLYASRNNGVGWTRCLGGPDPGATVVSVACHPVQSGLVAAGLSDGSILVSRDCGRRFEAFSTTAYAPTLLAWADGGETPRLLVGGDGVLCDAIGPDTDGRPSPAQDLLAQDGPVGPVNAIATHPDGRGGRLVAAARSRLGGIVFSADNGWDGGFFPSGMVGHDVRSLGFVTAPDGAIFLAAGCARPMVDGQHALWIAPVDAAIGEIGAWAPATEGWSAGTINALAGFKSTLIAGGVEGGVRVAQIGADGRVDWQDQAAGDMLTTDEDRRKPATVSTLALSAPDDGASQIPTLACGGPDVLSLGDGVAGPEDWSWRDVRVRSGAGQITIPADWVICGDAHVIEVRDVRD